jgi:hypothetical protein
MLSGFADSKTGRHMTSQYTSKSRKPTNQKFAFSNLINGVAQAICYTCKMAVRIVKSQNSVPQVGKALVPSQQKIWREKCKGLVPGINNQFVVLQISIKAEAKYFTFKYSLKNQYCASMQSRVGLPYPALQKNAIRPLTLLF